ncbi:hypothetical protein YOLOSWAG_167 [Erwinia phage vB_EamM_Yoloswag]|uniref:Uncharacterized protein n=1 Tax=Erwinia phage vB_EamM_Yoloswag TaxID=1958956 RepID=A0A1S6L398_9CAUD|nr:hypothetical protein HOR66_gp167 [Erwinia phage vB_EamM_Yoloswag]AQT28646.1 hypothetical protein YOLOSWAG_167 [Erwinia phage vB_EamM_Yoloswag]
MTISTEQACDFLNTHLVHRPDFVLAVLRTCWQLNPGDVPPDIDVFSTSSGCCVADFLGVLNGLFASTGQSIKAVNIEGQLQFITEKKDEEMPTSQKD